MIRVLLMPLSRDPSAKFARRLKGSLAIGLFAVLATSGCNGSQGADDPPILPAVQLIQPQKRSLTVTVEQPSFVESYERTSIYPKMTAYIEKWNVDIGDKVKGPVRDEFGHIVKDGQVLATLFVPELVEELETKKATVTLDRKRIQFARDAFKVAQAEVKAATARISETRALLQQVQADVARWDVQAQRLKREVDKGVVEPQVLLEVERQLKSSIAAQAAAEAAIAKAEADLLAKESALKQADSAIEIAIADLTVAQSEARRLERLVGYLTLSAPFDGIITVRNANTQDFVLPTTGDPTAMARSSNLSPSGAAAPLFVVDRTDIVRVFVDIPERDANYVRVGTKASVLVRAFRDQPIAATVTRTSWALNVKSRTLRAEIDLPNTDTQILPGMYAYGTVIIERPEVWTLPLTALDYRGDKTFCWLYHNGRAVHTQIRTGATDEKWIEVLGFQVAGSDGTDPWVPADGSQQVIRGDLAVLADGEPVQKVE